MLESRIRIHIHVLASERIETPPYNIDRRDWNIFSTYFPKSRCQSSPIRSVYTSAASARNVMISSLYRVTASWMNPCNTKRSASLSSESFDKKLSQANDYKEWLLPFAPLICLSSVCLFPLCLWKCKVKGSTLTHSTFCPYFPAMAGNDSLDIRKTNACPFKFMLGMETLKYTE